MTEPEKNEIIADTQTAACGCVTNEYSDGRKTMAPCVVHGLMRVAQCFKEIADHATEQATSAYGAADAMAAVAKRLHETQNASAMAAALNKVIT